ncbi:TPA: type IV conjugative transfer system lipoprotein TraV [Klebsiella aerogenes]|uniref:type IV conjugative transfer system lipoprotein TraV n=1 Tax=Klebsiella sp. CN_Kp104 TaxID=3153423 RepID=UPI0027F372D8|nr:type IV conjugative transfer system lipoprotein TraV [Klebsiella aerogenes]
MKGLILLIPLGSALLLTGCAGTETDFQCNATTSDTCMTMEQANEKAKAKEERSEAKPVAAGLPRLADGNFRTTSVNSYPLPPQPDLVQAKAPAAVTVNKSTPSLLNDRGTVNKPGYIQPVTPQVMRPVTVSTFTSPPTVPGQYPRPLRKGEQTTSLWIAPYVDSDDVYHQPTTVLFVVTPSAWGQPRLN